MKFQLPSGRCCGGNWSQFLLVAALFFGSNRRGAAEIIFQDLFKQSAGSVTNSVPQLDVEGTGWQVGSPDSGLVTDGQGHLFNPSTTNGAAAGIQLIPIGPHGFMTVSTTVNLPASSSEWIGFGFGNDNQFLTGDSSHSGPWLKVQGDGAITLYGGAGENNPITVPSAYTNTGSPIKFALVYNAFTTSASVGVLREDGTTNFILNCVPITNSLSRLTARYLVFQFPSNASLTGSRWISDVAVDWFPRPRPLLALPTPPPENIIYVGDPTDHDITLIQNKLDKAAAITNGAEVRFQAGATYIITNNTTESGVPVLLQRATNVLVNGNGCKILIKNPHLGFFDLYLCKNIIVEGFSVDYDPLPFTQGVVTTNLSDTEDAFEFRVDPGYPSPTQAYFHEISQWGTFMDPTRPGRLADNHSTIYDFPTNTDTATSESDVFKVKLNNRSKLATIKVGDIWCQLARFNGSTLYRARFSYQITFLNLTNYTGAAAAFAGNASSLVNEINCQIAIGPSPAGPTGKPRVKTTNADGGLFGNPRIGPWVEGCNFIGLSDDVANANTLPLFFTQSVTNATNTFYLAAYNPGGDIEDLAPGEVEVGDDVFFYNGTNGVVFDRATITAVDPPYCTFDHKLTNIVAGTSTTNTCIFDNSLNTSAVYLNNQFSNSRIHGIYCRANNILIAHNYITGMGSSAIAAHPALSLAGPNSFAPTNCIILDNVLADGGCSYEAVNNVDPTEEPVWALLQLHKAIATSDYVPQGQEISGIRILHNAFLQWRRGAITLHNVSDANIIGNYFSPPMTNDGLTSLDDHVVADLWACDYNSLRFANNVKSTLMPDSRAISAEDYYTNIPGAFQPLDPPQLKLAKTSAHDLVVNWMNHTPAFVLQQADTLDTTNWMDVVNAPDVNGNSNAVSLPFLDGAPSRFYRARQR